jgi:nucleoside-diphosphate-sugar epimerase
MKYVITGASGFIGTKLYMYLLENNHEVRGIPRDYLYNYFKLKEYLELEQPDVIVHLAAYGNHSTQNNLYMAAEANISATITLLEASKDINYRCLINTSTSSVNLDRQTFYSATKRGAEEICRAFSQEYDKPIVSVRPYSVYGPGEASHRFIPTVIRSIKIGEEFTLAPNARHDWIYIKDFIEGILSVVRRAEYLKGETVEVGTGISYSNLDVVENLELIASGREKYNQGGFVDALGKERANYKVVDSLRSYDSTSWECKESIIDPQYSLFEGLKETYELS